MLSDSEIIKIVKNSVKNVFIKNCYYEGYHDDVLSHCCVKVFENLNTLTNIQLIVAFTKTTAKNKFIDHKRRNEKSKVKLVYLDNNEEKIVKMLPNYDLLGFNGFDEIIDSLPPSYKIISKLKLIDGLKNDEIAKKLDVSVGTVKCSFDKSIKIMKEKIIKKYGKDFIF